MSQVRSLITRLEAFREKVQDARPFYRQMQSSWTDLARRVVEQTLLSLRPGELAAEAWQQKVDALAARVTADFLDGEEIGLAFSLAPRPPLEFTDDPRTFTLGDLKISDVEEWVARGREKASPDDPGKNLDGRDAGKSDLQIAWRIMYALKLGKPGWDRLLGHLRDFTGIEAEDAAELLYPELLKAWVEFFSVRAPAAWRTHLHKLVAEI